LTKDHPHDGGEYHAADVLKELTAAIERRGIQDAKFGETFILQKRDGEGWLHELVAQSHDIMPAEFACRVDKRPEVGWRVVVQHVIAVTTMLYEHDPRVRG
jgi:hypothetical protein